KRTTGRFVFHIVPEKLEECLGPERFHTDKSEKTQQPGIVTGLAWTAYGGDILQVECIPLDGKGLKITGQLGDVMNESVNIAFSYVRSLLQLDMKKSQKKDKEVAATTSKKTSKADEKKSKKELANEALQEQQQLQQMQPKHQDDYLAAHEIHLHIPAGATPKDGPSAGITMALAFHSLANKKKIRSSLAMTGELSLAGKVLPVGGIKEKVLAAKRAGIKEIILPFENQKDLKEVPERHRKGLKFYSVKHFEDVLKIAYKRGE
ncbi:MAG: magnesium chelatase domain-containing protein, partial [Bacteriovoracaceae bacterium]|nr:magnesium chelatase domain-containing protein [Bacteriovoracaceae bacterium]